MGVRDFAIWKDHPDDRLYYKWPDYEDWPMEQLRYDLEEYECFICKETHKVAHKRQKLNFIRMR